MLTLKTHVVEWRVLGVMMVSVCPSHPGTSKTISPPCSRPEAGLGSTCVNQESKQKQLWSCSQLASDGIKEFHNASAPLLTGSDSVIECRCQTADLYFLLPPSPLLPPSRRPPWTTICRHRLVQDVDRLLIHVTHTHTRAQTLSSLPTRFD